MRTNAAILIGLRASGKTTFGKAVAEKLGVQFADLDNITPILLDCDDPAEAIRLHGEAAFRQAETRALTAGIDELEKDAGVLALGGGTPKAPRAADLIRNCGFPVIYLRASAETLASRLLQTDLSSRPSLTGRGVIEEVADLFADRDPLYTELATSIVEQDGRDQDTVIDEVARLIAAAD